MSTNHRSCANRSRRGPTLSLEALEGRVVPAVVVSPATVSIMEGQTKQVSFSLNKQPTAEVTFTLQSNNIAEAWIDVPSLTFTPDNWNTPQTVTITAIEDLVKDGNKSLKIVTSVSSSTDKKYAGKAVPDVTVRTIDSQKINLALCYGDYSGTFKGAARGTITATVSEDNTISVIIQLTGPVTGTQVGSGSVSADGSFSVETAGEVGGATYTGKISIGKNGTVSASGKWQVGGTSLSGSWQVRRISST